jgi:hypothetical protein
LDPQVQKWRDWCTGTVTRNVETMYLHRYAWREVTAILSARNPPLPASYWWEFMRDTYATTQAVAVRRQADTMLGTASLARLLTELAEHPEKLTRDLWLGWRAQGPANEWSETDWEFGGNVGVHLDPAIPRRQLVAVTGAAATTRQYVNAHVAHADAAMPEVTLDLATVHDAIDVISDIFLYCHRVLTAQQYVATEPRIEDDGWLAVFREAWIAP